MNGIYITSKNNNKYFYNNDTGFIEHQRKDMPQYEKVFIPQEENIKSDDIRWATEEEVKTDLFSGGSFRQLILEVTQNCNLACKYCCFGDHYKSTRPAKSEYMTEETGKKAIDYYMSLFSQKEYMNPAKNPAIGFYGGEPLLNFNLIKKLMKYLEEEYSDYEIDYNITTNGVLMDEEVMDFLVKYKFSIVVSLDGDKENHDRNRVNHNGEGSFDIVMSHIKQFKNKYPDYDKFSFSTCYDYGSDLEAIKEYIEKEDLFVLVMNMISSIETDYYEQFTPEQIAKFDKSYRKLYDEFLELAKNDDIIDMKHDIYRPLFLSRYIDLCSHSILGQKKKPFLLYGGCCVPGDKIFVSSTGKLHTCERISDKFPIGDVDNGLDFKKITDLINAFNKNQPKCKECKVSRLCSLCYSKVTNGDKIEITDSLCQQVLNDNIELLTNYINVMEENPKGFDKVTADYFRELTYKTNGTLF